MKREDINPLACYAGSMHMIVIPALVSNLSIEFQKVKETHGRMPTPVKPRFRPVTRPLKDMSTLTLMLKLILFLLLGLGCGPLTFCPCNVVCWLIVLAPRIIPPLFCVDIQRVVSLRVWVI